MAEAILLSLSKMDTILLDETTKVISSQIFARVTNLNVPGKIEEIRKQLLAMNSVIEKISTAYLTDVVLEGWISEVRTLAYRVEDAMDKIRYYNLVMLNEGSLKRFFSTARYNKIFSEIVDEVIQIEKSIKEIIKVKVELLEPSCLVPDEPNNKNSSLGQSCFPEHSNDEDLVGLEHNRRLLTEWLHSDKLDNKVITVSGMGGIGKTTLVTSVYEHEKVNFPAHAWIVVSQVYNVATLLRILLQKIGYKLLQNSGHTGEPATADIDEMEVNELTVEIKRKLQDTKCLIVLDDLWEEELYYRMRDTFQNHPASRIIITTRKMVVADLAPSTCRLQLQPLCSSDAYNLFCKRAFISCQSQRCPIELEELARDIVHRCQGLPLAIVMIGSLLSMRPQIEHSWRQTYHQLQSELLKNNVVFSILNLCYHDLSGDLRNCFLYCSLFPEDYTLLRDSLVRLWVAEGFVRSKVQSTPEEVAQENLLELVQRNMLEVVENDELGMVSSCKMHDVVRNLALSLAQHERFGSADDYGKMLLVQRDVRRLSTCGWRNNSASTVKFPQLRTLVSLGTISSSPDMLLEILSESMYLAVLELQDSNITEVPTSIGNLFNVRYIGLRRTNVKSLPESIENLSNLHTLDIRQTKIKMLPRGIVKAKKLRNLLADRYVDEMQSAFHYFVGVKAPMGLSNLEELQTLETVEASMDLAEQLNKLMQLRSIWIDNINASHCARLFATLSKMPLLSTLLLSASNENEVLCFENLKPTSPDLNKLIIRGSWASGTLERPIFLDHGRYLKYLALSWCRLEEDPMGVLSSYLPNLTYLRLNRISNVEKVVLSAGCFPYLKTLVMEHMLDVNQLEIMEGALPCIESFYVVSLANLKNISQGITFLRSLKTLWLFGLHKDFKTQWDACSMSQKLLNVKELRL